jgi:hypothetical protein
MQNDIQKLGTIEDELLNRRWKWANNLALNDYLKEQIECLLRSRGARPLRDRIRSMRGFAVREMWHTVAKAHAAQEAGRADHDPALLRSLHPRIAALSAVHHAGG